MGDCSERIDEKCGDLLPYCDEDAACSCMVECPRQAGVGGVDACLAELGLAVQPAGFVQLEECVAFACPDADECATLENAQWTLLDSRIGPLGEEVDVSDPTDLCWHSSHHNFEDGHGGTEEGHDGARRYHLYTFEEGPLEAHECAPTAEGSDCIEGPTLVYAYEP